jgi:hypothetical protein
MISICVYLFTFCEAYVGVCLSVCVDMYTRYPVKLGWRDEAANPDDNMSPVCSLSLARSLALSLLSLLFSLSLPLYRLSFSLPHSLSRPLSHSLSLSLPPSLSAHPARSLSPTRCCRRALMARTLVSEFWHKSYHVHVLNRINCLQVCVCDVCPLQRKKKILRCGQSTGATCQCLMRQ